MNWQIDSSHTRIGFKVRHLMVSNVRGQFDQFSGAVVYDPAQQLATQVSFKIDVASVNTQNEQRNAHLKSPDFFDAANYPEILFTSTQVGATADEDEFWLDGALTIRGITRPVRLKVERNGIGKSPWGQTVAGFDIEGEINRTDFGLDWNVALETGGFLVGEKIKLEIQLEMIAA